MSESKTQLKYLLSIISIILILLLTVVFYLILGGTPGQTSIELLKAGIPSAIVALIAVPLIFFFLEERGITTAPQDEALDVGLFLEQITEQVDKKVEEITEDIIGLTNDTSDPNPVKRPEDSDELKDALIYYFAQSQTSRATLHVITHEFRDEPLKLKQLVAAVHKSFELRNRNPPSRQALNKIIELLQAARFVAWEGELFRATRLGTELGEAIFQQGRK